MPDTPVVETGIAIGALCITRQVALKQGKETIAFQVAVDSTSDHTTLDQLMDTISHVAERERLKADLSERLDALRVAQEQPAAIEKEIERLHRDKAAHYVGMQAAHSMSRKRLDFAPTDRQKADLDKYDQAIENAKLNRKNFTRDIPIIEWEIGCLRARIAGEPEPEKPAQLHEAMAEMAMQEAAE